MNDPFLAGNILQHCLVQKNLQVIMSIHFLDCKAMDNYYNSVTVNLIKLSSACEEDIASKSRVSALS